MTIIYCFSETSNEVFEVKSVVLGSSDSVAVEGARISELHASVLADNLGHADVELGVLGHGEELVNTVGEGDVCVPDESGGGVSQPDGQISNLPVGSVLEALCEPAVVTPAEVAS
jgi:hypothetical protein